MADHKKNHGAGHPFFPGHLLHEAVVMLGVIILLMFLAVNTDLPAESVADPTDTSYIPRPEWYFLFLFQFLKYFPGSLEVIAAVVLPTAFIGLLLFLPFIDKNPATHPKKRPLATSTAIVTMVGIIILTFLGMDDGDKNVQQSITFFDKFRYFVIISIMLINFLVTYVIVGKNSPLKDPASKLITASVLAVLSIIGLSTVFVFSALQPTAAVAAGAAGGGAPGKAIIAAKCTSCHKFEGQGAEFAPDLTKGSGKYKTVDELTKFLKDPASIGSGMPKQQLSDQEIKDIAEFMASLSGSAGSAGSAGGEAGGDKAAGGAATTADNSKGQGVFDASCKGCHAIDGAGGTMGPELSSIGSKMDAAKIAAFVKDPAAVKAGSPMPKLPLSEEDLKAVAEFLASKGGKGGAAAVAKAVPAAGAAAQPQAGTPISDPRKFDFAQKTIDANSCKSCHKIGGEGGSFGPNLSKEGSFRDAAFIAKFLKNPKEVNPQTQMPVVPLTAEEIAAISDYLASLK